MCLQFPGEDWPLKQKPSVLFSGASRVQCRPDREPQLQPSLPAGATGPGCGVSGENGCRRGSSLLSGSQFPMWRSEGAVESHGGLAQFRQEHSQLAWQKAAKRILPTPRNLCQTRQPFQVQFHWWVPERGFSRFVYSYIPVLPEQVSNK